MANNSVVKLLTIINIINHYQPEGITFTRGYRMGPPVISWFINHIKTPISYSYIYHKP